MFGRGRKTEEEPLTTLARCIVLLDDIRAYRRKDVEQIDATFAALKKTRYREHYDMWVKARPSAEKIVDMPLEVSGAKRIISAISWTKVANRIFLIILVFFVALILVPVWEKVLGERPFGGNAFLYATIAVILVVVTMNAVAIMDYLVRKRIIAYEDATMDKYAPARDRMRECVNKMMHTLAKEVNRTGADPSYYGLVLYFDDYSNIKVVKKWQPKSMGFFKKPYSHFQVVPNL